MFRITPSHWVLRQRFTEKLSITTTELLAYLARGWWPNTMIAVCCLLAWLEALPLRPHTRRVRRRLADMKYHFSYMNRGLLINNVRNLGDGGEGRLDTLPPLC